jgi:TPR repeat protein
MYRLAAAQGNLDAQLNLASMYYEGEGVPENLALSHTWLAIVALPRLW